MFSHVSPGSPSRRPHMIPPSPTVVGGRHLASVAGLESVLVQPDLCSTWGEQEDKTQTSRRDGCTSIYPTAGNGRLMMLDEESFARPMTRNNDGRQQQEHFQPAKAKATMIAMGRSRDGYYDNATIMERTVSPSQHHQRQRQRQQQPVPPPLSPWQVLEPDATVQVRHPTTGTMECYRVDYQAYVMTQSEAHKFLQNYGGDYNGGAAHEVQLEQLLVHGLRQPPGRLVSSPSSSSL
jgi:hypothetical protein